MENAAVDAAAVDEVPNHAIGHDFVEVLADNEDNGCGRYRKGVPLICGHPFYERER